MLRKDALRVFEEFIVLERDSKLCVLRAKVQFHNQAAIEVNLDFVDQSNSNFNDAFASVLPELNQFHFDLCMWAVTKDLIDGEYINDNLNPPFQQN